MKRMAIRVGMMKTVLGIQRQTVRQTRIDIDRQIQIETDRNKARQRETARQNRVIDFSHSFFMGGEQL